MNKEQKETVEAFGKWIGKQINFSKILGGFMGQVTEFVDDFIFIKAIECGVKALDDDLREDALVIMQAVTMGDTKKVSVKAIDMVVENVKTALEDEKERIVLGHLWEIVSEIVKLSSKK